MCSVHATARHVQQCKSSSFVQRLISPFQAPGKSTTQTTPSTSLLLHQTFLLFDRALVQRYIRIRQFRSLRQYADVYFFVLLYNPWYCCQQFYKTRLKIVV